MIGQFSSTVLQAIAVMITARFLGSVNYGQLTVAMIPISIASLFNNPGVHSGLIRYIAQFRSENRKGDIRPILLSGLFVNTMISTFLVLIIFMSSGYLANDIFNQPEIQPLIQIASINVIALSLIVTSKGIFVGFEKMEFISLSNIVQSILRSILAPLLVFMGLGPMGAALGNTSSLVITVALGLVLTTTIYRQTENGESSLGFKESSWLLLTFGLPIFLSAIFSGALLQFYKFLMALHIDTFSIGNYQAAINFSGLVSFLTMPISTVLFPLFSKFNENQKKELGLVYKNSIKYASLMSIPVIMVLILLAGPLVNILYGNSYPDTAFYLQLYCINFLFIGLGRNCHSNLLKGQGKTKVILQNKVIDACLGIPLGLILIPRYGIVGLILSAMIPSKISLFRSIWWIFRNFGFTLMWITSAKIFIASGLSYLASYFVLSFLNLDKLLVLIVGGTIFFVSYLLLVILLKIIDSSDIMDLRKIIGSMGPFSKIFTMVLDILQKVVAPESYSS